MTTKWNFNSPGSSLKSYYDGRADYSVSKRKIELLEKQLSGLMKEADRNSKKLEHLSSKPYKNTDNIKDKLDKTLTKEQQKKTKQIEEFKKRSESDRADAIAEENREVEKNSALLKAKLDNLAKSSEIQLEQSTEKAQKALEMEGVKRDYEAESYKKIDVMLKEHLSASLIRSDETAKLEAEILALYEEYEPKIEEKKSEITSYIASASAKLSELGEKIAEEEASKDGGNYRLELEREYIGLFDSRSDDYVAAKSGFDVKSSEFEKSKSDALSGAKSRYRNELSEIESKLGHLKAELSSIVSERDGKIKILENRIASLTDHTKSGFDKINEEKIREQTLRDEKIAEADKEILSYVKSQGLDHSDNYDKLLGQFKSLQSRKDIWYELGRGIDIKKIEDKFELELVKQRQNLSKMSYDELETELRKAQNYKDRLGIVSKKPLVFTISGIFIAVLGLIVLLLPMAVKSNHLNLQIAGGSVGLILGIILAVYSFIKPKKELSMICRFISLASDSNDFTVIEERAISNTESEEAESIKELGSVLWHRNLGEAAIKSASLDREREIRANYEMKSQLHAKNLDNGISELERQYKAEEDKLGLRSFEQYAAIDTGEAEYKRELAYATLLNRDYELLMDELRKEKEDNLSRISDFDANYESLLAHLHDSKWPMVASEANTDFESEIYVIPTKAEYDEYGHASLVRVETALSSMLVTYDSYMINHESGIILPELALLLGDFMRAFYRSNAKMSMKQYVCGEIEGLRAVLLEEAADRYKYAGMVEKIEDVDALATYVGEEDYYILYHVYAPWAKTEIISEAHQKLAELLRSKAKKSVISVNMCYKNNYIDAKNDSYSDYNKLSDEAKAILHYENLNFRLESK